MSLSRHTQIEQIATARGAYGFRITGLDHSLPHLNPVPMDWPSLRIEVEHQPGEARRSAGDVRIDDQEAEVVLAGGDCIALERDPLTVRFTTQTPLTPDAILHPYLGLPASIAARWLGRIALHGGAFVHEGRAWALLGQREAGKSSTLGHLATSGHSVLSDDVLIVEGTKVFAGPRSVDLRAEPAAVMGGESLGVVGGRPRWRLRPQEGSPVVPLGGLIVLDWGEATCLEPLSPKARLSQLIAASVLRPRPETALSLLELAALPAWRFARPPGLGQLGELTDQLLTELSHA